MNHSRRGSAIIIDNYEFEDPNYTELNGHTRDVENYKETFSNLGFKQNEIELFENKTEKDIIFFEVCRGDKVEPSFSTSIKQYCKCIQ